jgi:hypothetical protein
LFIWQATTDLRNTCTIKHTGTSASAPLAAGIVALALEVKYVTVIVVIIIIIIIILSHTPTTPSSCLFQYFKIFAFLLLVSSVF